MKIGIIGHHKPGVIDALLHILNQRGDEVVICDAGKPKDLDATCEIHGDKVILIAEDDRCLIDPLMGSSEIFTLTVYDKCPDIQPWSYERKGRRRGQKQRDYDFKGRPR